MSKSSRRKTISHYELEKYLTQLPGISEPLSSSTGTENNKVVNDTMKSINELSIEDVVRQFCKVRLCNVIDISYNEVKFLLIN